MSDRSSDAKTVVVGAGLTGLTVASLIAGSGEPCLLIEKNDRVGGLARTFELDGVTFDLGPHLLFLDKSIKTDRFIKGLLKNETFITKPFVFGIKSPKHLWCLPNIFPDFLFSYPLRYRKEILKAFFKKPDPAAADMRSVKAMVESKAGRAFYTENYGPLMLKKTLIPGERLHRAWAHRVARDVHGAPVMFSGIGHTVSVFHKIRALLFPRYQYPAKGFGVLAEAMEKAFLNAGGELIFNSGDIRMESQGRKIRHVTVNGVTCPVKNLIWTGSANALNTLLDNGIPATPYVDVCIVLVTYRRKRRSGSRHIYTYHINDGSLFNRLYYPDHVYTGKRSTESLGICAEISLTPETSALSDPEIRDRTLADIQRLGIASTDDLRACEVHRLKDCMPVYGLDYESELDVLFEDIRRYENLYAIGRQGSYFFCQAPGAVAQGIAMAEHLMGEAAVEHLIER